jgi:hypothetical protein
LALRSLPTALLPAEKVPAGEGKTYLRLQLDILPRGFGPSVCGNGPRRRERIAPAGLVWRRTDFKIDGLLRAKRDRAKPSGFSLRDGTWIAK